MSFFAELLFELILELIGELLFGEEIKGTTFVAKKVSKKSRTLKWMLLVLLGGVVLVIFCGILFLAIVLLFRQEYVASAVVAGVFLLLLTLFVRRLKGSVREKRAHPKEGS